MKRIMVGGKFEASAVVLGCMRMGSLDLEAADRYVHHALDLGVDFFDHADIYGGGECETLFGKVLARNPGLREKMYIQSKCGIRSGSFDFSKEHILNSVDGILKRLGVEYLDTLLLHRPDAIMEPEEVAEAFDMLENAGKVRYFGVSNMNAGQIMLLKKCVKQDMIANQMQFGLAHTIMIDEGLNVNMHTDLSTQFGGGVMDYCRLNDITIQAWSPFQHGWFEGPFLKSEKYEKLNKAIAEMAEEKGTTDAAIACAWIARHPANIQTIAGTMNEKHLSEICAGADVQMTRQEWYKLYLAAGNRLP